MDKSGEHFPWSQFVRDLQADSMRETVKPFFPSRFNSLPPGGPIDLASSVGMLPNLTIWISHYRTAAEALPLGTRARQLIVFPGDGTLTVETRTNEFVCDGRFGVSVETEGLVSIRFRPGRSGAGALVDRLTLLRRLARLTDAPLQQRLTFDTRFDTASRHQAAVGELIRAVLAPTLGQALTASPATASKLSATMLDLVLHSLPHNYSDALLRRPAQSMPQPLRRRRLTS